MTVASFDVIIVGSGAGGSAAAHGLVKAGHRVLLLEKGHSLPTDGSTLDIGRVVHQGEFLSRESWQDGGGRALRPEEHFNVGGKTKWYGAALLRFAPHEFAADPGHACKAWPLEHREFEPWYQAAERLLGVREIAREPDLTRLCRRLARPGRGWHAAPMPMGLSPDIGEFPREAAHFDGFASVRGLKAEAQSSLLAPLRQAANLRLETGAEVTNLIGQAGRPAQICGVVLADGRRFTAPHVVLAAGALHSPRILAGYLAASGLERSLPCATAVGRNLKLHLLTAMVAVSISRTSDLIRKTTVLTHDACVHSSVQPLGFDAELIATLVPRLVPRALARAVGSRAYGFFLQTEDGSDTRNRVLDTAKGPPILDYDERRLSGASGEHLRFTRHLQLALARAGWISFTQRIGLNGTAHACGTLIAGLDPRAAVVDRDGAVHGMAGLHVADGSVLPRSSRVNPSLSIYAWGLRLGDSLARRLDVTSGRSAPITGVATHA